MPAEVFQKLNQAVHWLFQEIINGLINFLNQNDTSNYICLDLRVASYSNDTYPASSKSHIEPNVSLCLLYDDRVQPSAAVLLHYCGVAHDAHVLRFGLIVRTYYIGIWFDQSSLLRVGSNIRI